MLKRHICLEEGTSEAEPLSQQDTSEMLLDAWLKACLQRICSYASSLLSYLPCFMETFQGSWGCIIYCFWHLGKPSSSYPSRSRHWVSGGGRLPCPGPSRALSRAVWPLFRGHYLGSLSPCLSSSAGPSAASASSVGMGVPALHCPHRSSLALARISAEEGWAQ